GTIFVTGSGLETWLVSVEPGTIFVTGGAGVSTGGTIFVTVVLFFCDRDLFPVSGVQRSKSRVGGWPGAPSHVTRQVVAAPPLMRKCPLSVGAMKPWSS